MTPLDELGRQGGLLSGESAGGGLSINIRKFAKVPEGGRLELGHP